MTIGRRRTENRYRRLRDYLWTRYVRCGTTRWRQLREDQPQAHNCYLQLVTALDKRQKEKTC